MRAKVWDRHGTWTVLLREGRIAGLLADRRSAPPRGWTALDLHGLLLLPGFHDPHVHLLAMARALGAPRLPAGLRGASSLRRAVQAAARPLSPGSWLRVCGFDHDAMTGGWIPDRDWLDAAVGDRPVRLQHRNLRLDVLNSAALVRCGLHEPAGSAGIETTPDGRATGRVFQSGTHIRDPEAQLGRDRLRALVAEVSRGLLICGVTSIQDAGEDNGDAELALLDSLAAENAVRQRLWTMVSGRRILEGSLGCLDHRRVVHAKLAAVEARLDLETLVDAARAARRRGLGVAVHAVTEAELAAAVATIEAARVADPTMAPPGTYRIEHAAVATGALVEAVARAGATVVANPSLVTEAGGGYLDRHDASEVETLHRLRTWRRAGVPLALASDAPVTPARPLDMMVAAMTRATVGGRSLGHAERIGMRAAVQAATSVPALLAREDRRLGRVAPGYLADLVAVRPGTSGAWQGAEVALTIVGGAVAYEAS